jgi:hypothetical protein
VSGSFAGPPELNRRAGEMLRLYPGGDVYIDFVGPPRILEAYEGTLDRLVWSGPDGAFPLALVMTSGTVIPWHAIASYWCEPPAPEDES